MNNKRNLLREIDFTNIYRKYKNEHIAIREAMCLKAQFPAILDDIEEDDRFAGRISPGSVGFSIEEGNNVGYYFKADEIMEEINSSDADPSYQKQLQELLEFWQTENTNYKVRKAYPRELTKALPSDNWQTEAGIAFPLYRMAGVNLNYKKLLNLGLTGLLEEVGKCRDRALQNNGDADLFQGMIIALKLVEEVCLYYSEQAGKLSAQTKNDKEKEELNKMADLLKKISCSKPETLREAIQLFWLYTLLSGARNYGRMDIYLGDFYINDLKRGILTEKEALVLLESLWRLMADRQTIYNGRIIIGGKGRPNEENADKFALLAIEATRRVKAQEPQLSLRFYDDMNPELMERALLSIGEGRTFPILYNDDVNIPAVKVAFQVNEKEALQYLPFGCGEYVLDHRSFGTPNGVINLLKALEITLHNGVDPISGKRMGIQTGEFKDFHSFEELFNAYKKQVEYYVDKLAKQEELEYKVVAETAPCLYLTMLYDDCLEKGKPVFNGGIRYLGGTLETYGNTNTADSLIAIKKLVYENKVITQDELLQALDNNFNNYPETKELLIKAPKYGNDNIEADDMAQIIHNHICKTKKMKNNSTILDSYLVVVINNNANTILGRRTAASADGRKLGTPMANGNAPSSGMDNSGLTAMLNSLVKLDAAIHAGVVQNIKFSKKTYLESFDKVKTLLDVYFKKGGTQAMITVVGRDDLENAIKKPEEYKDLYVRVGGFTARFIELDRDVQQEILERTLY